MINGRVTDELEAVIELSLVRESADPLSLEVLIDTGFNGFLAIDSNTAEALGATIHSYAEAELADGQLIIVPRYLVAVELGGRRIHALAISTAGQALVGMSLLRGLTLSVDVWTGGGVYISGEE